MDKADAVIVWNAGSDSSAWASAAAGGSRASLAKDSGGALRLDFHLEGSTSWVIARSECRFELPAHYAVVLKLRGSGAPNQLQVKLVDPTGANVWWWRRPSFPPPAESLTIVLRQAALEFAWGPLSGADPCAIAAVEIAIAAGEGGSGWLAVEELRIEERSRESAHPTIRRLTGSSCAAEHDVASLLATEGGRWTPESGDALAWLQLDLGVSSEWGGFAFECDAAAPATRLFASEDALTWTAVAEDAGGAARSWLRTADGEGRFARIEFAHAPTVVRVGVVPLEVAVSPARFIASTTRSQRRGLFPRWLAGEQAYWAIAGADADERKGLLSEDGALEIGAEQPTIEPFVWTNGRLITWADVTTKVSLADGRLPVPSVEWKGEGVRLRVTAFGCGEAARSTLVARYEIECEAPARLFLAIRPFQVNPSWQSLNITGGVSPITRIEWGDGCVLVGTNRVVAVSDPDGFGAAPSEEGLRALGEGRDPARPRIEDPLGFAEAALRYDIEPGRRACVAVAVPLHEMSAPAPSRLPRDEAAAWADARLDEMVGFWRARLSRIPIELPACAQPFAETLAACLGWILCNREGPRIQPGPRCYRRSWIRDGALTGTALAEMGFADEARAFLRWYAPYQHPDGRVPCAVDRHGIDPVPEHDSHGEFIWGIVEVYRLTGDREFLAEMWPRVLLAADAITALRAQRTGDEARGMAFYGLLPESISHEGYSSRPVHAFWDDFFAVRGIGHAGIAAAALEEPETARRFTSLRETMRSDLHTAIARAIKDHQIDFVPGSVELGDFDPTSTAIAFDPCNEASRLPPLALAQTFDRYWQEFEERRSGTRAAEAYTAYEIRSATALMLLGHKARALELLEWLVGDQRPPAWHQWPEVTTRDPRAPRFLGDLPHGWIASSFVRTLRRMIVFEREDDGALVLAAGIPAAWVREAPGVRVRALPTHAGPLDFWMRADGNLRVAVTLGGLGACPAGGIVIESPFDEPLAGVVVDGEKRAAEDPRRYTLSALAREIVLEYAAKAG